MANTDSAPATRVRRSSLEMVLSACDDFAKIMASHGATVSKRTLTIEDVQTYKELETALSDVSSQASALIRDFSVQLNVLAEKEALIRDNEAKAARIAELEEMLRVAGQGNGEAAPAQNAPKVGKGSKAKENA